MIMQELKILADELRKTLAAKELELREHPNFNSYTEGALLHRRTDVDNFEFAAGKCDTHPLLKKTIILNFEKEAAKIKVEIDQLSCHN